MSKSKNLTARRFFFFGVLLTLIPTMAFLVIRLAQGYRPDFATLTLRPSGILVATSNPEGAQLFIDGDLISATDTTLNLPPGEYEIEIRKDGFSTWKKILPIEKELVMTTEAYLFPTFPNLRPLTFTGASNPVISPDGQKTVYTVSGASPERDGLWVLDLADRPLGFNREPRLIAQSDLLSKDFSQAEYTWSPDSKQILVTFRTPTNPEAKNPVYEEENYVLESGQLTPPADFVDITATLTGVRARWEEESELRRQAQLSKLPQSLLTMMEAAVGDFLFSPDETKLLYVATASASIPEEIIPPLPATNPTPETRQIEPENIYVYDLEQDKNYFITKASEVLSSTDPTTPPENKNDQIENKSGIWNLEFGISKPKVLTWFPTSRHLFLVRESKVTILEYDATNWIDIYSGPFVDSFVFPFPSDNKVLLLTSLGSDTPPNLYALSLR